MKANLIVVFLMPMYLFSQEMVGIYAISFSINQNLLQEYKVQTGQNSSSNTSFSYRSIPPLSDFLHDSVRFALEKMVAEVFSSEANCIYRMNRKNEPISTIGYSTNIRGLPRNCLRTAVKLHDKDTYVRVYVRFYGYSVSNPSIFGFQKGFVQPVVSIRIKAYNVERKKIYNQKIRYSNFPQLKNFQVSGFGNQTSVTRQEILSSNMIFSMLKETISAYKSKYLSKL